MDDTEDVRNVLDVLSRTDDEYRKIFWDLKREVEQIEAITRPLRAARDVKANALREQMLALSAEEKVYLDIEKPLFAMKMNMSKLVKLLNGKTGEPPA